MNDRGILNLCKSIGSWSTECEYNGPTELDETDADYKSGTLVSNLCESPTDTFNSLFSNGISNNQKSQHCSD